MRLHANVVHPRCQRLAHKTGNAIGVDVGPTPVVFKVRGVRVTSLGHYLLIDVSAPDANTGEGGQVIKNDSVANKTGRGRK